MKNPIISVIGLGKAGLPLAAVIARAGLNVIGVDIDAKRCAMINSGQNPLPEEPGLGAIIKKHGGKKLRATSDALEAAKEAQVHIVIVPLFIDEHKQADFSIIDVAFSNLAQGLKKGDIVVLETTVPPGTTETRIKKILEKESKLKVGKDFHLAYSPERIMTGYSISRFTEFPKVIGGVSDKCGKAALQVYKKFVKDIRMVSNCRTAEMIKVSEGIFRDVNIGLANELMMSCEKLEVDFAEMREHANHAFCNIHQAGLGVGGHCIPVYPWLLMNEMMVKEMDLPITRSARFLNDAMIYFWRDKVLEEIKEINKPIKDIVIGVYGINYRSGVKETAYSRTIPFIKLLEKTGFDVAVKDAHFTAAEIQKMGFKPMTKDWNADLSIILNAEDFPALAKKKTSLVI